MYLFYAGITCGNFCIYCGKHALCGLLQDHSVDPDSCRGRNQTVTGSRMLPDISVIIRIVPDKTIHEFPCYSFVLGRSSCACGERDVCSVPDRSVVCMDEERQGERGSGRREIMEWNFWRRQLLMPHILLAAVLIGMFRFTNYWDFIIYFVVAGGTILFAQILSGSRER